MLIQHRKLFNSLEVFVTGVAREAHDPLHIFSVSSHFVLCETTSQKNAILTEIQFFCAGYTFGLCEQFVLCFNEIIITNLDLGKNPCVVPLTNVADCMQDESIDIRNDSEVKRKFKTNTICNL